MKARYFPNCEFLDAKISANPSFVWRSIMSAHDVIKQGCRKRIGNGENTKVWKVSWLPCGENGYLTTCMPPELENLKLKNLMEDDRRSSDHETVRDIFNERDVELILKIPLSARDSDVWFQYHDAEGRFTVRSCYRQLQGEQSMSYKEFWKQCGH